jgi:hypothetical protein
VTATAVAGGETRSVLHRVAAHVLARRRYEASGRFGLRASPGGFVTPPFGEEPETLRVTGAFLVRERGGASAALLIDGSTMQQLAVFAGTDLDNPFSCGEDTPPLGDVAVPLAVDADEVRKFANWYDLGWIALDHIVTALPAAAEPATIQLWPEHFDAGTNVGLPSGERVNLGFSPGDAFEPGPYAYVGPQSPERRGDPAFWNAPFGAVLRAADVAAQVDPLAACIAFLRTGIELAS